MLTPLRYPGGKARLGSWIASLLRHNNILDGTYVEAYAGGAGAAIYLLVNEYVSDIIINDIDPAIYSFWYSILNNTSDFIALIESTPLNIDEWEFQREVYKNKSISDKLSLGFATFFLNRTNRSGILKAGLIGGKNQAGNYKMDARFNKVALIDRIKKISAYRERISIFSQDADAFISFCNSNLPNNSLTYLDPPYYQKGSQLYTNFYNHNDHLNIARNLESYERPLIITYDSCDPIKAMYMNFKSVEFDLIYSTHSARIKASEMLVYKNIVLPSAPFMCRSVKLAKKANETLISQMVI
jgi:DNA adenine methylase